MDILAVFLAGGLGVFLLMGLLVLHEKFATILHRILPKIAKLYRQLSPGEHALCLVVDLHAEFVSSNRHCGARPRFGATAAHTPLGSFLANQRR